MLANIFDGSLMPHGHCILWREDLLLMTLLGNGLTVIAYAVIPMALVFLIKKRDDLEFNSVFLLFAGFIAFCGISHILHIVNIWHGYYFLQGLSELATGLISILTAIVLWRLMPSILTIPSRTILNAQNEQLRLAQDDLEQANLTLEKKVKERTEALEQLASTDSLTQVKNRRAILDVLENEFQRTIRYPHGLSLLMLDIDFFKAVNDTFGHLEGDKVLVEVAAIISATCRQTDAVGRYGGEEFLIVLPETSIEDAKDLAEKIRIAIVACDTQSGAKLTCSIGVSTLEGDETVLGLIKKADDRVYKAKVQGRNQVVYSD
jgi:diguanylate cyclase (GGDEF)-like protein